MIGMKEIAQQAGVSVSTVSNVLNGKSNVSAETKERILNLCKTHSYYLNTSKRAIREKENKTILFNFSDFDTSFYLKIINGISDYVNENDYDLIICTQKSCEKYMTNKMTKGAIVLDERMKDETLLRLANENYPIIALDRMMPENSFIKSIVVNNYDAMKELVQGLVAQGHRKFGFVGGLVHTTDNQERYEAFLDVLEENGIPFNRKNYIGGDFREKSGYKAAKIFMLGEERLDVLVCSNDNMAIGAIKALRNNGYQVPKDISVTGFDDSNVAEVIGLTTVTVPNYERGYLAARYLIESLTMNPVMETLKIAARVKWRNSTLSKKGS